MPKINVKSDSASPAYLSFPDGNEYTGEDAESRQQQGGKWCQRVTTISWVKEGHLEIGVAEVDTSTGGVIKGTFMTLDRVAANRLIRGVQQGRNAVFGKDA